MNNIKQHFDELDICKGIAILAVLWNHSFILYPINIHELPWCQHAACINSTFYLVVFFMVSGYLFSAKKGYLINGLKKKFKRLFLPYLFFETVNLSMKLAMPSLVNRPVSSVAVYLSKAFLFGGEMWFLYTLFLMMVIWSIILTYINRKWILTIMLFFLDWIIEDFGGGTNYFLYKEIIHYSIFFLIGNQLRTCIKFREIIQSRTSFLVSLILFIPLCCVFVENLSNLYPTRIILKLIGCWFVWSLSFIICKNYRFKQVTSFIGKNSLGYYWLNGFVLVISRTIIVSIFHCTSSLIIAFGIFLFCLLLETLSIFVIKKIPKVGFLFGI